MSKSYFQLLADAQDPLMTGLYLNADAGTAMLGYHQAVMRGDSELSPALRELIGAFVSGLNGCELCHTAHTRVAELMGYERAVTLALMADIESAPVDNQTQILFGYLKTLVQAPATLTAADAARVFAAGWSERAVHDAINVTCLFNFINRFVLGHGITATAEALEASARKLVRRGYG